MQDMQQAVLNLIPLIYQAAGDDEAWRNVITAICQTVGADQGLFVHHNSSIRQTNLECCINLEERYAQEYDAYYQYINPYISIHPSLLPNPGTLGLLADLIPDKEVEKGEFFNDHVSPQGLTVRNAIRITLQKTGQVHSTIALHYAKDKRHLDPASRLRFCELILPHLQTALQLHTKISHIDARLDRLSRVVDTVLQGVVLLDISGQVLEINDAARVMLERADGLHLRNHELHTMLPGEDTALYRLINGICKTIQGEAITHGRSFPVLRPSGKRPFELLIAPAYEQTNINSKRDNAIVIFIHDPDATSESREKLIRHRYNLTVSETKVTIMLVQGYTGKEIADAMKISRETLKSHLKHIFKKTNTHRQSELISVVMRSFPS